MKKVNTKKYAVFILIMLFANTAKAYSPDDAMNTLIAVVIVIAVVVFLFIIGAVNYFSSTPDDEPEVTSQDSMVNTTDEVKDISTTDELEENQVSKAGIIFRKSLLIFVIIVIILLIIAF
jgi:Na+/melibiose symporter-like transporter